MANKVKNQQLKTWPYANLIRVRCADCAHYRRNGYHTHLGLCAAGEHEPVAGLWDQTVRYCTKWEAP
jgi:hypothetical protein